MPPLADFATMLGQIKRSGGIPKRDPGISQGVSQGAFQGTNPSLINLESIFGGGPSTPTEPTAPSAPTVPTFESYDATPELNSANAAEQEAYGMQPTQVQSNWGTKDLLALLVAGLAGERGGDVLSGYMKGKQQSQAQHMAAAAQADQMAQQKKLQEAAAIRAGIPFKQSRVDKANQLLNDQFKIQTDAYNNDQTNKRILSVADKNDQLRRWVTNQTELDKKPYTYRAQWAMENLGITAPDILEQLAKPNTKELKDISSASLNDARTKTEDQLRGVRYDTFKSRVGLTDAQAKEVAAKTLALPDREAALVAHLKKQDQGIDAQIQNLRQLATVRNKALTQKDRAMADANLRAAAASFDKSAHDSIMAVKAAQTRLNILQKDYNRMSTTLADGKTPNPEREALKTRLFDASQYYANTIKASSDAIAAARAQKAELLPPENRKAALSNYGPHAMRLPDLTNDPSQVRGIGGEELNTSMFPDQKGKSKITVTDVPGKGAKPKGGAKKILDSRWNRS